MTPGFDNEAYVCTLRAWLTKASLHLAAISNNWLKWKATRLLEPKFVHLLRFILRYYILPMENVLATKGTGVVTSVPSDSPDDFPDLRKKPEFYKIDPLWSAIDPVLVISTPTYGEMTAPAVVKQLNI